MTSICPICSHSLVFHKLVLLGELKAIRCDHIGHNDSGKKQRCKNECRKSYDKIVKICGPDSLSQIRDTPVKVVIKPKDNSISVTYGGGGTISKDLKKITYDYSFRRDNKRPTQI